MIKEIVKTESRFDISLDNGKKHHLDILYMHNVIGYQI